MVEFVDKEINEALNNELEAYESKRFIKSQRALFGDPSGKIKTFAILSPENPKGALGSDDKDYLKNFVEYTTNKQKYNSKKLKELKNRLYNGSEESRLQLKKELEDRIRKTGDTGLRMGGFDYIPISGKYGDSEHSFLILNCTLEDAKILARDYGQESFFFGIVSDNPSSNPSRIGYYKTTNHCRSYKLIEVSNTITDEEEAEDYFSRFGAKFRINLKEFGDKVTPITDDKRFKDSLESATFMQRASARRDSRK